MAWRTSHLAPMPTASSGNGIEMLLSELLTESIIWLICGLLTLLVSILVSRVTPRLVIVAVPAMFLRSALSGAIMAAMDGSGAFSTSMPVKAIEYVMSPVAEMLVTAMSAPTRIVGRSIDWPIIAMDIDMS